MRYSLNIAYDGTRYSGWQMQPNANTVQAEIEAALSRVCSEDVKVMGCGRTDAGVHSTDFVLHFDLDTTPSDKLVFRLNQLLPFDIAVKSVQEENEAFHARFDAKSRAYIYRIHGSKDPFLHNKSLQLITLPDIKLMNQCCSILLEYDDFASFCKAGADNMTTICDLMEAQWKESDNGIEFYIKANRFLRNMVRAVVGTMLDVGLGKTSLKEFKNIIEAKDRQRSGKSAAAWGLYLAEINY